MLSGVSTSSLFAKCIYVCTVRGCAAMVLHKQRAARRFGLEACVTAEYLTAALYAADDAWDSYSTRPTRIVFKYYCTVLTGTVVSAN